MQKMKFGVYRVSGDTLTIAPGKTTIVDRTDTTIYEGLPIAINVGIVTENPITGFEGHTVSFDDLVNYYLEHVINKPAEEPEQEDEEMYCDVCDSHYSRYEPCPYH